MNWQDLIIDGYGRVLESLKPAMAGLSQAELNQQPGPDCNSIGWIAWHLPKKKESWSGGSQVACSVTPSHVRICYDKTLDPITNGLHRYARRQEG